MWNLSLNLNTWGKNSNNSKSFCPNLGNLPFIKAEIFSLHCFLSFSFSLFPKKNRNFVLMIESTSYVTSLSLELVNSSLENDFFLKNTFEEEKAEKVALLINIKYFLNNKQQKVSFLFFSPTHYPPFINLLLGLRHEIYFSALRSTSCRNSKGFGKVGLTCFWGHVISMQRQVNKAAFFSESSLCFEKKMISQNVF